MILSTWFYSSPKGESFSYPSVGDNSSEEDFQLCYFKCVVDFFASSFAKNYDQINTGDLRHIFYCNSLPNFLEKIRFQELMLALKVETVLFEPTRIPNFSREKKLVFGSVFCQLDVLELLSRNISDDEFVYLMDNDVISNKPLSDIDCRFVSGNPVYLVQQSGALDQIIQGKTLLNLMGISKTILSNISEVSIRDYVHTGGEIVAMDGKNIKKFSSLCNKVFDANTRESESGSSFFETEEQIFSCAYTCFDRVQSSNYIERIWTDEAKYRTVSGTESNLCFLHVPSEKRSGFMKIFDDVLRLSVIERDFHSQLLRIFEFNNIKKLLNL